MQHYKNKKLKTFVHCTIKVLLSQSERNTCREDNKPFIVQQTGVFFIFDLIH